MYNDTKFLTLIEFIRSIIVQNNVKLMLKEGFNVNRAYMLNYCVLSH